MVCADKVVDVHSAVVAEWLESLSVLSKKTGGKRQKYRASYIDCICAFDIETSVLPHVRSRDIALEAVAALKYAPLGERGMTTSARVLRF